MENKELYESVLEDSSERVKSSILEELSSEDFDWDQLITLIIEEGSPLQDVFSGEVLQLGTLYSQAQEMVSLINDMTGDSLADVVIEPVEIIEEKKEDPADDFAEFEDL